MTTNTNTKHKDMKQNMSLVEEKFHRNTSLAIEQSSKDIKLVTHKNFSIKALSLTESLESLPINEPCSSQKGQLLLLKLPPSLSDIIPPHSGHSISILFEDIKSERFDSRFLMNATLNLSLIHI